MSEDIINWSPDSMLEVTLKQPDDFLKVRETLTRIGVASRKDKTLYQSCHILHKQGRYFITHFKELFALDGKKATLVENDIQRRNTITILLQDWNLIDIVRPEQAENKDKQGEEKTAAQIAAEQQAKETEQKHQQLLNKVTDDPYLLLRNKMQLEYQKRKQNGTSQGVKKQW